MLRRTRIGLIFVMLVFFEYQVEYSSALITAGNSTTIQCPMKRSCVDVRKCPKYLFLYYRGQIQEVCGWIAQIPMVCCGNFSRSFQNPQGSPNLHHQSLGKIPDQSLQKLEEQDQQQVSEQNQEEVEDQNQQQATDQNQQQVVEPNQQQTSHIMQRKSSKLSQESVAFNSKCGKSGVTCSKDGNATFTDLLNVNGSTEATENRIYGGQQAVEGKWPWMVGLYEAEGINGAEFFCGGTLITTNHVLTAAHCMVEVENVEVFVLLGDVKLMNGTRYEVEKNLIHENYTVGKFYYDLTMIKLKTQVKDCHIPICLPTGFSSLSVLYELKTAVIGWGYTSSDAIAATVLQELTEMPIVPLKDCVANYKKVDVYASVFPSGITDAFICAGFSDSKKDTCKGDSGGPLMVKYQESWIIIGVVSFGYECAFSEYPGVYTKIEYHLKWINNAIETM